MYRIRKSFTFEAAHQLEKAFTSACSDCIHGHSYTVEMFITAEKLNDMKMVVDFGYLKAFKQVIMDDWDHGLHLHESKKDAYVPLIDAGLLAGDKVTFWSIQPTAEAMAKVVFNMLEDYIKTLTDKITSFPLGIRVEKVRIHETSTGWAEYQA